MQLITVKAPFIVMMLFTICLTVSSSVTGANCSTVNGGSKFASTIVVDKSGGGNFSSIQSAIDSIPPNNDRWIKVRINPGVYNEQVSIPRDKTCIFLEGEDRNVTTITFDAHNTTASSATFTSIANNIVAKGITFKNSYNHLIERRLSSDDSIPPMKQAVAARVLGDKSAFFDCGFLGLQDTLYDARGRHYFFNCYVEGAMDFIWGSGQSFYEDCSINVTAGAYSSRLRTGYITAQGRNSWDDPSGFVFKQGTISGTVQAYLGRAYGAYSRVIFHETTFDFKLVPQGWFAWNFRGKEGNITYAEVNCKGRGSNTSKRVPWEKKLNSSQLEAFSLSSFVDQDGWIGKLPLNASI